MDLSKAFDKVPRRMLLEKMRAHGITEHLLCWIDHWLSDRKQRTVLNGTHSDWGEVSSGVPQGSVLGPLAFLIYINDIDALGYLITIIKKFADDTKLGHIIKDYQDQECLQNCLNSLIDWATTWSMEFNVQKCKVMHVGHGNPRFDYTMSGQTLSKVTEEKDFGVITANTLKPSRQCAEAAKQGNRILGQISRAFHYRDRTVFRDLYVHHVRPHLEYCTPVWSPWTVQDIDCLERVQKRAVRMISGLEGTTYDDRLKEPNLQTLESRRKRSDMVQTYKIVNKIDRVDPSTWFQLVGTETRTTRNLAYPKNLTCKRSRTEIRKNFFSMRVPDEWNRLPVFVKESRNLRLFKANYDKHIRSNETAGRQ